MQWLQQQQQRQQQQKKWQSVFLFISSLAVALNYLDKTEFFKIKKKFSTCKQHVL